MAQIRVMEHQLEIIRAAEEALTKALATATVTVPVAVVPMARLEAGQVVDRTVALAAVLAELEETAPAIPLIQTSTTSTKISISLEEVAVVDLALVVADQALAVKTVISMECLRIAIRSMILLKVEANFQTCGQSMEFRLTQPSTSTMMALINKAAPLERLLEEGLVTALEAVRVTVQVVGQAIALEVDQMADLLAAPPADLAQDLGLYLETVQVMVHKMEQMVMETKEAAPLVQWSVMGLHSKLS